MTGAGTLLDLIIDWIVERSTELTDAQRAKLALACRPLEVPDAIDAELAADAKDRPAITTVKIEIIPPKDVAP
jgi:hypothetical protein